MYQKDKSFDSKVKFRQVSNHCKRVLEAAKLVYANKTKESITSQKLGSQDFWQIANGRALLGKGKSVIYTSTKVNLLYISPLFNGPEVLSSASDKVKLFVKNFSKNSNIDDSGKKIGQTNNKYQDYLKNPNKHSMYLTEIEPDEIRIQIQILNSKKTSDIFRISANFLKFAGDKIIQLLTFLFNESISYRIVPDKLTVVYPIYTYKRF